MHDNDKDLRFIVKPGIGYVCFSALGIISAIALMLLDSSYYVVILVAFVMGFYNLLIYLSVRVFVYRDYFVVINILKQSKKYTFDEVTIIEQGVGWNGYRGFVIKDCNGKRVLVIGDYFTNIDELLKAMKKKRASKPQQKPRRRRWLV